MDWKLVGVLLVAASLLAAAVGLAFVADADGAPVNLATEAAGVVVGTTVTVYLIEDFRRRRELRDASNLRRNRLIRELSWNLGKLVTRHKSGAFENHMSMSRLRRERQLTLDDVEASVTLSKREATALAMAIMPRIRAGVLRTDAMEAALGDGSYLELNEDGEVLETPLHSALERIVNDIGRLKVFDGPSEFGQWDVELVQLVAQANQYEESHCEVPGRALLSAFAFYDTAEDVFKEQTALLRHLLKVDAEYSAPTRQPMTPLGVDMEQGIRAEQVSPSEVVHLVQEDLHPFGSRILGHVFGDSREERIEALLNLTRESLSPFGLDLDDPEVEARVLDMLEGVVDQTFADEGEGIEPIEHPRRRDS